MIIFVWDASDLEPSSRMLWVWVTEECQRRSVLGKTWKTGRVSRVKSWKAGRPWFGRRLCSQSVLERTQMKKFYLKLKLKRGFKGTSVGVPYNIPRVWRALPTHDGLVGGPTKNWLHAGKMYSGVYNTGRNEGRLSFMAVQSRKRLVSFWGFWWEGRRQLFKILEEVRILAWSFKKKQSEVCSKSVVCLCLTVFWLLPYLFS